jgi:hypothetical protein
MEINTIPRHAQDRSQQKVEIALAQALQMVATRGTGMIRSLWLYRTFIGNPL